MRTKIAPRIPRIIPTSPPPTLRNVFSVLFVLQHSVRHIIHQGRKTIEQLFECSPISFSEFLDEVVFVHKYPSTMHGKRLLGE